MNNPVNIFWFRRDLRLEDNSALYQALSAGYPVLPLFIFDTNILDRVESKTDPRVHFIHKRLNEINKQLLTAGSSILILKGKPVEIWKKLFDDLKIIAVYCNQDYEPYAIERDAQITQLLSQKKIPFLSYKDQVIFEKNDIVTAAGKPYTIFTPYMRQWQKQLQNTDLAAKSSESKSDWFIKKKFSFPDLDTLGFVSSKLTFPPKQLDENLIAEYDQKRNFPALQGTSRLGMHLRFGTISIRSCVKKALQLNEVWLQELIWREFFMMILYHFPYVVDQPFRKKFAKFKYLNDREQFQRWCTGQTGYPLVDAGMRELNCSGFMHNRVRMVTAGFLTKHLLIDWRWGEAYFAQKLLDYELSSNNGNWQWAAGCGCDAAPYFRIFNPEEQAKKFDPGLLYIRKWIPELESNAYPSRMIDHKFARERALSLFRSI
jgi:deoxyribodipyrimidine photo-lyase